MFLVGLDIVGDKLMEINVFSPGGLGSAQKRDAQAKTRNTRSPGRTCMGCSLPSTMALPKKRP